MVHTIVLATRNAGKVKEFQQLLQEFPVQIKSPWFADYRR
jgi:inosine/xanthosine triphosphate pyrophosphatase family protein